MDLLDWALLLGRVVVVFFGLLLLVLVFIWMERKVIADMQTRSGPLRAGPRGILVTLADGARLRTGKTLRDEVERLLKHCAKISITDNIEGAKWTKLVNSSMILAPFGMLVTFGNASGSVPPVDLAKLRKELAKKRGAE